MLGEGPSIHQPVPAEFEVNVWHSPTVSCTEVRVGVDGPAFGAQTQRAAYQE